MNENVLIKNSDVVKTKLAKFKNGGLDSLHIVADFDRTLTKAFHDGNKTSNSIAQLRQGGYLSEEYIKTAYKLFDKYNPIEIDTSINEADKKPIMEEWWKEHLQLMINSGLTKSVIEDIITTKETVFREGFSGFINILRNNSIPLLILSAGLGDIVEGFLKKYDFWYSGIFVFSNYFRFDDSGSAIGYKSNVVHVLNKDEQDIINPGYKEMIAGKKNVILLGDNLGDLKMTDSPDENVLSIGFLNEKIEENRDMFMNSFDVVIEGDGSMNHVNDILKELVE